MAAIFRYQAKGNTNFTPKILSIIGDKTSPVDDIRRKMCRFCTLIKQLCIVTLYKQKQWDNICCSNFSEGILHACLNIDIFKTEPSTCSDLAMVLGDIHCRAVLLMCLLKMRVGVVWMFYSRQL